MASTDLRLSAGAPSASADGYFKDKTLLPGQGHDWLGHDFAILTLVVRGRLEEGFAAGRQCCGSWELHYKPPGAVHTTATGPDGARMLLAGLRPAALAHRDLEIEGRPRSLGGGVHAARALAIFAELDPERGALRLDALALRELLERSSEERGGDRKRPWWITEVHERVVAAPARDPGLGGLAADFRVHPVYLARAFRAHYGASVGEVRRRARVERGVERLTAGVESLSRLAAELGYCDQSHFTREFKQATGWTPGSFRRTVAALERAATAAPA